MCALHAINAAVGGPHFAVDRLRRAAESVVSEAAACAAQVGEVSEERIANHMLDNGWFSEQALAGALEADGRWLFDQTPLRLQPHGCAELASPNVAGALVQRSGHWFALRVQEGAVWVVDSQKVAPECLGELIAEAVQRKLASYRNVFLIRRCIWSKLRHHGQSTLFRIRGRATTLRLRPRRWQKKQHQMSRTQHRICWRRLSLSGLRLHPRTTGWWQMGLTPQLRQQCPVRQSLFCLRRSPSSLWPRPHSTQQQQKSRTQQLRRRCRAVQLPSQRGHLSPRSLNRRWHP